MAGASDGNLYVAKFLDSTERPNSLFNESAGYEIYRLIGLRIVGLGLFSLTTVINLEVLMGLRFHLIHARNSLILEFTGTQMQECCLTG